MAWRGRWRCIGVGVGVDVAWRGVAWRGVAWHGGVAWRGVAAHTDKNRYYT